ncbi:hypothetical protein YPD27_3215 [Yersinia pestis KIM D27]|nr:hypothetical protein YPD27_3215 [Yersinia pestis KIM D27]
MCFIFFRLFYIRYLTRIRLREPRWKIRWNTGSRSAQWSQRQGAI